MTSVSCDVEPIAVSADVAYARLMRAKVLKLLDDVVKEALETLQGFGALEGDGGNIYTAYGSAMKDVHDAEAAIAHNILYRDCKLPPQPGVTTEAEYAAAHPREAKWRRLKIDRALTTPLGAAVLGMYEQRLAGRRSIILASQMKVD